MIHDAELSLLPVRSESHALAEGLRPPRGEPRKELRIPRVRALRLLILDLHATAIRLNPEVGEEGVVPLELPDDIILEEGLDLVMPLREGIRAVSGETFGEVYHLTPPAMSRPRSPVEPLG